MRNKTPWIIFFITLTLTSCGFLNGIFRHNNRDYIAGMSGSQIKKAFDAADKFDFRSENYPISYRLNMDTVRAYRKRKEPICKLIERELGQLQSFYAEQFDFDTHEPLGKKSSFCSFDTCNSEFNCGFNITYFSKFTIDKKASEAKSLPKLLFTSDKYSTRGDGTVYGLMLRIDISNVYKTVQNMTVSELDISTKFIWKQRSVDDTEGWEKINQTSPNQIDEIKYKQFIAEYNKLLKERLDTVLSATPYLLKTN